MSQFLLTQVVNWPKFTEDGHPMSIARSILHELTAMAAKGQRRLPGYRNRDLASKPIRLFWWADQPNFGDVLSPAIVRHLTGREVEWASLDECDLCAIGSIYGWIRIRDRRYFRDVHVWGSGLLKPWEEVGSLTHLHHHLVRGPLTALAARDETLPTGDPGLIAPDVWQISRANDARGIGVVPHWKEWSNEDHIAALNAIPGVRVIDLRTDDCQACIEEIAACEIIYSSSLHGLIVADAMDIPNFRYDTRPLIGNAKDYKYFDYALSVGRDLTRPVDVFDHVRSVRIGPEHTAYLANIPAKKAEIVRSFPYGVFGGDATRDAALIAA